MIKIKYLSAIISILTTIAVSSVAFAQETITLGGTITTTTSISVSCWNWVGGTGGAWDFDGASIILRQPADRGGLSNDPADANHANWPASLAGQAIYTMAGGNAWDPTAQADGGMLSPDNKNAFGYGDCKVDVNTGQLTWSLELSKNGGFASVSNPLDVISDMDGVENTSFDFNMDNDVNGEYEPIQEEHGFYVVSGTTVLDSSIQTDDGASFISNYPESIYTTPKNFDAMTCGTGTAPCYHGLPIVDGGTGTPHVIFSSTTETLYEESFVTRYGIGIDTNTEPQDDYSMSATYTLVT